MYLNITDAKINIETGVKTPGQQSKQIRYKEILYFIPIHQRIILFTKIPEDILDQSQT
jgi:hypothetical protein